MALFLLLLKCMTCRQTCLKRFIEIVVYLHNLATIFGAMCHCLLDVDIYIFWTVLSLSLSLGRSCLFFYFWEVLPLSLFLGQSCLFLFSCGRSCLFLVFRKLNTSLAFDHHHPPPFRKMLNTEFYYYYWLLFCIICGY